MRDRCESATAPISPRVLSAIEPTIGQVFWLPDQVETHAFPRLLKNRSGTKRILFPVTAAGPQRIYTVFPILRPSDVLAGTQRRAVSLGDESK